MTKYRAKRKYNIDRNYAPRDPYRIPNLYKQSNIYKPRNYGRAGMRRGYNSSARARSYTPSRITYSNPRQSSTQTYHPIPKQNPLSRPWRRTEPKHYEIRQPRIEPDTEQMLKQLEKKFDKKLHEQVLERLEAEFEKLQEALAKEKAEQEEIEQTEQYESLEQKEIEPQTKTEQEEYSKLVEPEPEETIEATNAKKELPTETESENELPSEEELYEIDLSEDDIEWLREQIPEIETEAEAQEPDSEILEKPESEILDNLEPNEVSERTEVLPVEGNEPLESLEPVLDQLEPLELELANVEALPEIKPRAVLPEVEAEDEAAEEEAY